MMRPNKQQADNLAFLRAMKTNESPSTAGADTSSSPRIVVDARLEHGDPPQNDKLRGSMMDVDLDPDGLVNSQESFMLLSFSSMDMDSSTRLPPVPPLEENQLSIPSPTTDHKVAISSAGRESGDRRDFLCRQEAVRAYGTGLEPMGAEGIDYLNPERMASLERIMNEGPRYGVQTMKAEEIANNINYHEDRRETLLRQKLGSGELGSSGSISLDMKALHGNYGELFESIDKVDDELAVPGLVTTPPASASSEGANTGYTDLDVLCVRGGKG